ncbi:membrane protein [Devosia pacifica]|uniref:Membrane protein n=1 Tax=Devosia pacifica TaxID=1335967 RepID=A0A918S5W5_9HYPH|nr:isoprenylcysteine carboxylmethyltransferase family protein [Devosia pacifica]GHA26159.1 membrane protein [Devosia pacifica]
MTGAVLLLLFVTLERLAELFLARRNTKRLLERGAVEHGSSHYPFIVLLHGAWLAGLWLLAWDHDVQLGWLAIFAVLQVMRVWVLLTLGPRWTTRIIVVPDETLVSKGPYRFLPHPNYVVVIGEIAVLPLALGLVWFALAFSVLNAIILFVRIRAEQKALGRS